MGDGCHFDGNDIKYFSYNIVRKSSSMRAFALFTLLLARLVVGSPVEANTNDAMDRVRDECEREALPHYHRIDGDCASRSKFKGRSIIVRSADQSQFERWNGLMTAPDVDVEKVAVVISAMSLAACRFYKVSRASGDVTALKQY
jgi:hypothetical protein